jgi:hypothetical protein
VATLRPRIGVAALPSAARPLEAQLGALLSNINPIARAGRVMGCALARLFDQLNPILDMLDLGRETAESLAQRLS